MGDQPAQGGGVAVQGTRTITPRLVSRYKPPAGYKPPKGVRSPKSRLEPVRNSHVYIDLPNDDEGFVHFRTDAFGLLCCVPEERGARGARPMSMELTDRFLLYFDGGELTREERAALTASSPGVRKAELHGGVAVDLEDPDKQRRGLAYFVVEPPPFHVVVDAVELAIFPGEGPSWNADGDLESVPEAFADVQPLDVGPPPPFPSKRFGPKVRPRALPSNVLIHKVRIAGLRLPKPFDLGAKPAGIELPPDYVRRLLARAVLECAARCASGSLDSEAHNYIRRRYERVQVKAQDLDTRSERLLEQLPEDKPATARSFRARPPKDLSAWQRDLYDRLWLETDAAAADADAHVAIDACTAKGARVRLPAGDVWAHNRRVLRLYELLWPIAASAGAGLPYVILEKNEDKVVKAKLPELQKAVEPLCIATAHLREWADTLWPPLPPCASGVDARGVIDTSFFARFVDDVAKGGRAPDKRLGEAEYQRFKAGSAPDSLLACFAEQVYTSTARRKGTAASWVEKARASWAALEGLSAATRIDAQLVNRVKRAHADLLLVRLVAHCFHRLAKERVDALAAACKQLAEHTASVAKAKEVMRPEIAEHLEMWAADEKELAAMIGRELRAAAAAWSAAAAEADKADAKAREAAQAVDAALPTGTAADAGAAGAEPALGEDRAAKLDAADQQVEKLLKAVEGALEEECGSDTPVDDPQESVNACVYTFLEARRHYVRELKGLGHYR